ncbi:MAG: hypothetical protein ACM3PV_01340, partial [Betaproteobacteria bacterium]
GARDEASRVFRTMGIPTSWRRAELREALGLAGSGPATLDLPDASRLTRAELTAASMPVSPDVGPALRSALAGGPVAPRPDTSQLTVEHKREQGR